VPGCGGQYLLVTDAIVRVQFASIYTIRLDLHRGAVLAGGTWDDHQVAALHVLLTLHDLPERPKRVDHLGASRIGREFG
jgi:hypothetical protein